MLDSYGEHEKCAAKAFCNFCLLRSVVFKINMSKGRRAIQPVEIEVNNTDNMSMINIMHTCHTLQVVYCKLSMSKWDDIDILSDIERGGWSLYQTA